MEECSEEVVQLDDTSACTLFCSRVKGRKKCTILKHVPSRAYRTHLYYLPNNVAS